MSYLRNLGIAVDQGLNVALGPIGLGSGHPDETLSAFWGRIRQDEAEAKAEGREPKIKLNPLARFVSKVIDKVDPDHSWDAIERKPGETTEEPHHMGSYEPTRKVEEAALDLALERDDLTDEAMTYAESGAKRQRLREKARDRAAGEIK